MVKNLLIAVAVAFLAGLGIEFLDQLSGSATTSPFIMPTVLGFFVFFFLQMRAGNRKEVRIDDASRQSSLSAVAPAGQALLYIYREGFVGKMVGWNVSLDGTALAQLRSPRFTQTTLNPGAHTLAVSLEGLAGSQSKPGEATFDAQPGDVIVFAMKAKMGALAQTLLFVREPDVSAALKKFSKMPMVAAERPAGTAAA
jgi:hypothetical protein